MFVAFIVFFVGMTGWGIDEQVHPCDYPHSSAYQSYQCQPGPTVVNRDDTGPTDK